MTTTGSYNVSEANRSFEAEIARLRTQALLSWAKEARILTWFGLHGGNWLIGRRLESILSAAGFQSFDIEAVAISSDTHGVEAFMP